MIVHHRHQFQNALMRGPVSVLSRLQARPVLDREGNPLVIEGERMLLRVEVPVSTRCEVELPDGTRRELGSGVHEFACTLPAG